MPAARLDGAALAAEIRREVREAVAELRDRHGIRPALAVILCGENPGSEIYVRNKARACDEVGIRSEVIRPDPAIGTAGLADLVDSLNRREEIDGILIQLPLPDGIDATAITCRVDPARDVDGLHPENLGRLVRREPGPVPCTPAGILRLLRRNAVPLEGRRAVVAGRSNIVGKPVALLLMHANATVTVCHSRTRDLPGVCREAEVLIAAIGRPAMITEEFVRPGAAVVDVGIHRLESRAEVERLFPDDPDRLKAFRGKGHLLVGDVHPTRVGAVAGWMSPVPGGVGPLTVAMLLTNTAEAARTRRLGRRSGSG
ncbi:MAG: bifunctional methylenetetrahydrofolate dehydrogenase/methenyltetrahydrofolate cyclohydrolase FolD [Acidobacteria bacterium]|nr:bifunctional methylenetetrahydrofolate dehydrogenase/methenyltetrahydrofolate cyclohydrolase FolD [Acidobacteriota bacterium]